MKQKLLCDKYDVNFNEMNRWYDGYRVNNSHVYSPKSVVDSIRHNNFASYWTGTETYEALKVYIDMDYDGLKSAIVKLLAGERCKINTVTFANDMITFKSKNDVLALLVHLVYLGYDIKTEETFIPNEEIRREFVNAMDDSGWNDIIKNKVV